MASSATISQSQNVSTPPYSQKRNATPAGTMGPAKKAISQLLRHLPINARFQPVQKTSPVSPSSPDFRTVCRKPQALPRMRYDRPPATMNQNQPGAPREKRAFRKSSTTPE